MAARPDEDRDVIILFTREDNATTGTTRDRWMLFVGQEPAGNADTEQDAIRAALRLGKANDRPVWMLDRGGYPLKPITDDDRTVE